MENPVHNECISVLLVRIHVGCLHVGFVSVLAGLVSLYFELLRSSSFLKLNFINKKNTLGSHGSKVLYVFSNKISLQKTFG